MATTDIRSALKERLQEAERRREEIERQMEELEEEVASIGHLLKLEERRFAERVTTVSRAAAPVEPIPDFLLAAVRNKPQSKDELRVRAESAGYESAGRSVHATLLNLTQSGKIRLREDGVYEFVRTISNIIGAENAYGVSGEGTPRR